jgi:hypothetical protein
MKKAIYLISFVLLVSCGHNEETVKETELIMKEIKTVVDAKQEARQTAEFWRNAYTSMNVVLEKYKKADPEAIEVAKEAKELFEKIYDFRRENDLTAVNIFNTLAYMANSVTGKGTTIADSEKQTSQKQKQILEKSSKFHVHLEQVEIKLCNKYQLNCKAKTPDKPDQKKETKPN